MPNQYTCAPLPDRFWAKVDKSGDCWLWLGTCTRGYGRFKVNGRTVAAHRFAYEQANGPIADGLETDHLCRNHTCVRPDHMQAVSRRENQLRGESFSAKNAAKTQCLRGHFYDLFNTYYDSRGWRQCRVCHKERQKLARLGQRLETVAVTVLGRIAGIGQTVQDYAAKLRRIQEEL